MRHFERREQGQAAYFKLATFDPRSFTFRDGKRAFDSEAEARGEAKKPGKYRISKISTDGSGRSDGEPFEV